MSRPRDLAEDYVRGAPELRALWPEHFLSPGARDAALSRARAAGFHPVARDELRRQNEAGPQTRARRASLEAVEERGAVAVVTGQQPGLFLGPLLTLLKAASAIVLARALERERGVRCVPIFWVQEEDHDFDEIAGHAWLDASGRLAEARLRGNSEDRVSLADRRLGSDVEEVIGAIARDLAPAPHGEEVTRSLGRHYRPERSVASAFAGLLAEVFADEGLLVLQPRSGAIARALAPLHIRCIEEAGAIEARLAARSEALRRAGYRGPVPVRPGATLSFYHPEGAAGPRYRLALEGDQLALAGCGERVSRAAVREAADADPLRFSSSALLRPLLQDTLLPTVAYAAGPSELAYFAQLAPLYEHFGRSMPLVVPRLRARWIDRETSRFLGASRDPDALAEDGTIARELADAATELDLERLSERLLGDLERELQAASPALEALDPGLGKACARTRKSAARAVDRLVRKATRAALQRVPAERARLEAARTLLFPRDRPQERVLGWTSAAARSGSGALKRALFELDPLAAGMHEIVL